MARTGLYKSEVKKARDSLVAQGINPSVDALRVALGNTGSKTTIHKYLKELDEEGCGVDGRKSTLSDTMQDFVARLVFQMQEEANVRVAEIQAECATKDLRHEQEAGALKREITSLSSKLKTIEAEALQQKAAHEITSEALRRETIARRLHEQQVMGFKERLAENEQHRLSLEEKHQHSRDALEHYRSSIKEQRDQDQRRHEQQIQQLQAEIRQLQLSIVAKQDDVTRLNQEGARIVSDLSHAQKNLFDQQAKCRQIENRLDQLRQVEQQLKTLTARLSDKDAQNTVLREQLALSNIKEAELNGRLRKLELEVVAAEAKDQAQQSIVAELRTYLDFNKNST